MLFVCWSDEIVLASSAMFPAREITYMCFRVSPTYNYKDITNTIISKPTVSEKSLKSVAVELEQ